MIYAALVGFAIIGYLLGSLNAAVVISRTFYGSDIREHGSGNAGTTNMLRTFGKKAAAATFLVDLLKGVIAALLCGFLITLFRDSSIGYREGACIGGFFAVLGHNWPVYFGFKGGKGVLTSFAVMLVLAPIPALCALGVFAVTVLISRYVSLGSILAAFSLPFFVGFLNGGVRSVLFWVSLCMSVLLIVRHHANIGRLIHGTESKLGKK